MDVELMRLVAEATPPLNPDIASGLATRHIPEAEAYIDSVFRAVSKGFPEGFVYVRGERCTPQDEFNEITRRRNNRREFDTASSFLYMMRYVFRYRGEEIHRYMYLPYVGAAGMINLGGSQFLISPILADRIISIGTNNIFLRLIRAKVTFERMIQHYMADGQRETVQVAWSLVYNKDPRKLKIKPEIKAQTTLVHYLFCKYGFKETMQRFANCTPVVGGPDTINEANYPREEWVICSSTQVNPKAYGQKSYMPSFVRLAIKRSEYTSTVKNYVCAFFYLADHFPSRILPDKPEYLEHKRFWMTLMGLILFSSNIGEGKLADDVEDHIRSLDEYVDEIVKIKFRDIGMPVEDLYQIFGIVIENFNGWLLEGAERINSMYDKELSVLYYVLAPITEAINKFYFKLRSASRKELSKKEIETIFSKTLKPGLIYSITRNHGEISTVTTSGDNMAFKITSILVPQANSSKTTGRKDNATLGDPSKRLHVSVAEIGGYSALPKSEPTGRSRLNLHARVDPKGNVLRNPDLAPLLDQIQTLIRRQ